MDCGDNDFIFKSTQLVDFHFDFPYVPLELCHMVADWKSYALSNINYIVRLHEIINNILVVLRDNLS